MGSSATAAAIPQDRRSIVSTWHLLLGAAVACFALQGLLVFRQSINWDEFRFLADAHLLARGELAASVQTFHSHLFRWLLLLPGHEVDQIIAARLVMLLLELGTSIAIYRCARLFAGREASLAALLCYLTFSCVTVHGASFRFDPPSTFLLMTATALLAAGRLHLRTTAAVGALVAVAALITIKSVFYVPTLVMIGAWRVAEAPDLRRAVRDVTAGALVGAATLALLYLYHRSHITGSLAAQDIVSGSVGKTIGQSALLPQGMLLVRSFIESPLNWLIVIAGVVFASLAAARARGRERIGALALLSFAAPLATLLFYRNAFPYYYVFMLAPVTVVTAPLLERLSSGLRLVLLAPALVALSVVQAIAGLSPTLSAQRATLDAVYEIFPQPVDYIDRCSMAASSRKQGFFMSSWGTEVYRDAGQPIMRDILIQHRPAFVLINSPMLEWALTGTGDDRRLLAEDSAVLRDNFIPHWGPIWVAGKRVRLAAAPTKFTMLIAGRYTVETRDSVRIDGIEYRPGEPIELTSGDHLVTGPAGQALTLRWGDQLRRPSTPPPGTLFDPM